MNHIKIHGADLKETTSIKTPTMSTATDDWNDSVAKLMAKSGASKEATEGALHKSGGDLNLAIVLLNEKSKPISVKIPPPRIDSAPKFIDDASSNAELGRQDKNIDNHSVAKPRETPMYAPSSRLTTSATATAKESGEIKGMIAS